MNEAGSTAVYGVPPEEPGRVFDRSGAIGDVPDGYRAMNDRDVIKFEITF